MPPSKNLQRLQQELLKSCVPKTPFTLERWALGKKQKVKDKIDTWRIVRGDKIVVVNGPYRDQRGTVTKVFRDKNVVLVDGVNMRKRIIDNPEDPQGERIEKVVPCPVHYSNINLLCPITNLPTRIRSGYTADGKRVRVAVRSGAHIPKPPFVRHKPRPEVVLGEYDTLEEDAHEITYDPIKDRHLWANSFVKNKPRLKMDELP